MLHILKQYLIVFSLFFLIPFSGFATSSPWQCPYGGVYLGGGLGGNQASTSTGSVSSTSYFANPAAIATVNNSGSWTQYRGSVVAGIQAGHDWEARQYVYGIIFDYGALPLTLSHNASDEQYVFSSSVKTDWLFTLRGRLGYPILLPSPSLLYLTGGMAMTGLQIQSNFVETAPLAGTGSASASQNQIGWTAGIGFEIFLTNYKHTSMNIEYLYVGIPPLTASGRIFNSEAGFGIPVQSLSNPLATTANFNANLFKLSLNHRFDE